MFEIAAVILSARIGAIPGVPERLPDQTGPYTVAWSNDWFAYPMALGAKNENDPHDDFRTNAFTGTAQLGAWRACLDDSMLTSKVLGLRSDEITATLGYDTGPVVIGAGLRSRRDYRGQEMQNTWHRWLHDLPLHLDREETGEDAVAYALAELPGWYGGGFSLRPMASALIASNGESAEDAGALVVIPGRNWSVFFGARYQWRDGAETPLIRKVQSHERGACLEYGFARHRGFGFSVNVVPGRSWAGALVWSF